MQLLIQLRADARAAKDFATGDAIRDRLARSRRHARRPRRRHGVVKVKAVTDSCAVLDTRRTAHLPLVLDLMRVLGIDPGLNTTGYGVLDFVGTQPRLVEAGVVRGKARRSLAERVAEIHAGVADVIKSLRPEVMAIEELYSHYDRPTTAILMGHARGVILLAAAAGRHPGRTATPRRRSRKRSPATATPPSGKCKRRSAKSWAWRPTPSRPTWPTRWPSRCATVI